MVYFRKKSEHEKWECITTKDRSCSLEITGLPLNTEFVVKVRACTDSERGPTGDESSPITTKNLAYKIKDASTLRQGTKNKLPVYDVPFHEERDESLKIRTVRIGRTPEKEQTPSFKSVLMVSTSHSGKTNLLLGILNFIVGVSYNDAFRLGFAPELLDKTLEYQGWTTVYQFLENEGGEVEIPLMLIDIPRNERSTEEDMKKIPVQLISFLRPEVQST
uniref:Uncharacterized protein LOC111102765 n=1 Tax=Crassostrea virginica TaxID=6565 RepID=A0A8B8AMM8_CRAVI|nr:uncharacterized protein LOC111102765 [Crassostrea virginica]